MLRKFDKHLEKQHRVKMTLLNVGDSFEGTEDDYQCVRRARLRMKSSNIYSKWRWTLKLVKGVLTVKRIEDDSTGPAVATGK